jgi:S-adenosylmethionine:tRNA ribosyltransferase-isomerase
MSAQVMHSPNMDALSAYSFELPNELIAREPLAERSASRLLIVDPLNERFCDAKVTDLPTFMRPGDVAVFNNTRVIPARLFAKKLTGGAIEILIERVLDDRTVIAQMGVSKKPRVHQEILLEDGTRVVVSERHGEFWTLKLMRSELWPQVLAKLGHMPLPPYIDRPDAQADQTRYQTVYAKAEGSVAAPTAGLHFDSALLQALDQRGVHREEITLHVGAGTFLPVRVTDLNAHRMHSERIDVPSAVQQRITSAKAAGKQVTAIGTTSLRALESAGAHANGSDGFVGETDIFIRPGYQFQVVDSLLTNFHLPQSTLLMLVSALAGRELILRAYQHAIAAQYRFYSYGMLIMPGALNDGASVSVKSASGAPP